MINRGHPRAAVNHQENMVGKAHSFRCLIAHTRLQRTLLGLIKSGGVKNLKFQIRQMCGAFTPIARHAGLIIHKGNLFTYETIKQC